MKKSSFCVLRFQQSAFSGQKLFAVYTKILSQESRNLLRDNMVHRSRVGRKNAPRVHGAEPTQQFASVNLKVFPFCVKNG